jgi:hypothetical protein
MKLKFFISIVILCFIAFAVYSATKTGAFDPAEDFPRGALVYVQVADLPALIKLWNESGFRGKYTENENFKAFKNNHLGLKLASRWAEFNQASGFPIDLDALSGLALSRASIALYDIGKLEFVFIAPVSDEVFAATKFVQNQSNFEQQPLDDGTIVYRATVEADRGRQKQELIFANVNGRFILATSEKLLVQTLNNIRGGAAKNRLADEPTFKSLAEKVEPQMATVWVNQTTLGADYYFKRYWLMSEVDDLKNIRAGIFDFSIEEGDIVERRKFLLKEKVTSAPIGSALVNEMLSLVPENIPFYRLQKASPKLTNEAIENTLFDRSQTDEESGKESNLYTSSFDTFGDYSSYRDYGYSGENFDETIDEPEDDEQAIEKHDQKTDFSSFLQAANPLAVLVFTEPKVLPAPLFVEFNRAAIISLNAPMAFKREEFEAATAKKFSERTTVSASGVQLNWETKTENGFEWRKLELPMLGITANYAVRGDELILTNDAELLLKIIKKESPLPVENFTAALSELTVLNLEQTENDYTKIFDELAKHDAADIFFTGNVASLIASISDIKKIEIKRNYSNEFLDETIIGFR